MGRVDDGPPIMSGTVYLAVPDDSARVIRESFRSNGPEELRITSTRGGGGQFQSAG
jgi:hypothetical protein